MFRGLFTITIYLLSVALAILFFISLNIKLTLLNAPTVKTIVLESNIYQTASAAIRESIVKDNASDISSGPMLEILTDSIRPDNLQKVAEEAVDSTFLAIKDPVSNPKILLKVDTLRNEFNNQLKSRLGLSDKDLEEVKFPIEDNPSIDVHDNQLIKTLANSTRLLIILAIVALLSLIALFYISSSKNNYRFMWVGNSLLLSGIILFAALFFLRSIMPSLSDNLIQLDNAELNTKIKTGISKVISLLIDKEQVYLLVESIALFTLGILISFFGRSLRESNFDIAPDQKQANKISKSLL